MINEEDKLYKQKNENASQEQPLLKEQFEELDNLISDINKNLDKIELD